MKKLIITATCVAAAVSGFAQGTVSFQNAVSSTFRIANYTDSTYSTITTQPNATSGTIASQVSPATGPGASTGVIDVGLVWATSAAGLSTVTSGTLAGVEQIASAGQLAGSSIFSLGNTTSQGETVFVAIYAWDSSYGATLAGAAADLAAGGYFASAAAGSANTTYGVLGTPNSYVLGATAGPGTPIFGTTGVGIQYAKTTLLALSSTPEPATLALGGLGAAALLMFRRRNK